MNKKTIALTALAATLGSLSANAELLVGWETFGATQAVPNIFAPGFENIDATTGSRAAYTDWSRFTGVGSTDATYGSLATPAAGIENANNFHAISQPSATGSVDFIVVNNSGLARELGIFHFDFQRATFGAPEDWSLDITAGDLTIGNIGSGTEGVNNSNTNFSDFDLDLTFLADNTLGIGESVTFTLAFTSGNGTSGQRSHLDNVGVSAIPEPGTFALLAGVLAFGVVAVRRRK